MVQAVNASLRHVDAGGLPFVGQLISGAGYDSELGFNLVRETGDPSAHAEIVAMRRAMHDLGAANLAGARLLATGEPCALCYRFAAAHDVDAVYFAIGRDTAAQYGFDYRAGYPALRTDALTLSQTAQHLPVGDDLKPFNKYLELHPEIATPR